MSLHLAYSYEYYTSILEKISRNKLISISEEICDAIQKLVLTEKKIELMGFVNSFIDIIIIDSNWTESKDFINDERILQIWNEIFSVSEYKFSYNSTLNFEDLECIRLLISKLNDDSLRGYIKRIKMAVEISENSVDLHPLPEYGRFPSPFNKNAECFSKSLIARSKIVHR